MRESSFGSNKLDIPGFRSLGLWSPTLFLLWHPYRSTVLRSPHSPFPRDQLFDQVHPLTAPRVSPSVYIFLSFHRRQRTRSRVPLPRARKKRTQVQCGRNGRVSFHPLVIALAPPELPTPSLSLLLKHLIVLYLFQPFAPGCLVTLNLFMFHV